jgi:hypothetical protein
LLILVALLTRDCKSTIAANWENNEDFDPWVILLLVGADGLWVENFGATEYVSGYPLDIQWGYKFIQFSLVAGEKENSWL